MKVKVQARKISSILLAGFLGALLIAGSGWALDPQILRIQAPLSLKTTPIPQPQNLNEYVVDKAAAIVLGKALYWDMQVGSDGIQACASCHFQAGADNRVKNQISPGLNGGDTTFQAGGPNTTLLPSHFPFHERVPPDFQKSPIVRNVNDVASSMGVFSSRFVDIIPGSPVEEYTIVPDPVFNVGGVNTRRVADRNGPTVINAVFYWNNFWDGRAHNNFNGVNPFGPLDMNARIWANNAAGLEQVPTAGLNNSSLASQAVGPPGSDFEMSAAGRSFPKIGKKLLSLTPLGKQLVHPNDSVLGPYSRAQLSGNRVTGRAGLNASYRQLIEQSFNPKYWNSTNIIIYNNGVQAVFPNPNRVLTTNEFTQMEANFSLFFGLAVQLYEATLVSDDAPFDRFAEGDDNALTQQELQGLDYFLNIGKCINCHGGSEFTNATVSMSHFRDDGRHELINWLRMKGGGEALYDDGNYNVSVTPTAEDIGKGDVSPFINPLTGNPFPVSIVRLAKLQLQGLLPFPTPQLSAALALSTREAIDGAFKTPTLRNVELTGPYFHNGGAATLHEAMDVYIRGGNFPHGNLLNVPEDIGEIEFLQGHDDRHDALVAFLKSLTDERVRQEMAPFDHPQILLPNGHPGGPAGLTCVNGEVACDTFKELPAVGAGGRPAAGLEPLKPFLGEKASFAMFRDGLWNLETGDLHTFGGQRDVPLRGDWNSEGKMKIGVYRQGKWYLDLNHNGKWDGCEVDGCLGAFGGLPADQPVAGDWNRDGRAKIGIFREGYWYLDMNGNGAWDGCDVDACLGPFGGMPMDIPVVGDWTGDGKIKMGIFRDGLWALDLNGNGKWDGTPTDALYTFGMAGDKPVPGDWAGNGISRIGIFRDGLWHLDRNGNGVWDGELIDEVVPFGAAGEIPVAGIW